jgi:mannobiose 2-epimerase
MCYTIEALAEAALAFQDECAAEEALELFRLIDKAGHDPTYGGYCMAFTPDWQYIQNYKPGYAGPSPKYPGAFERKSFDWHLGLLEAFATLYNVTGDPVVRARVDELLNLFTDKIVDVNKRYGQLWFTRDWQQYTPEESSHESEYGLDCEASWLIMESAQLVGRMSDPKIRRVVLALTDHAIEVGFDKERGGLYNAGPVTGPVTNKTKSWWQQCEALVAFLNAFQMTGDAKYWDAFEKQARFIETNFVDHEYGEWYTSIRPDGTINTEKAGPWKAPYHVTRALLEVIGRLGGTL